jgi:hypothetical protein
MDTFEDNRERYGALDYQQGHERVGTSESGGHERVFECPACDMPFTDEAALRGHLFQRHAGNTFYLRANGRVISRFEYLDHDLRTLELIALGTDSVRTELALPNGGAYQADVQPGHPLNLAELLPGSFSRGHLVIRGWIGTFSKSFNLYVLDPPELDFAALDELVIQAQAPLVHNAKSEWRSLRQEGMRPSRHELERRYLMGFAEYFMGCDYELDGEWASAGPRYERALGQLRIFASDLTRSARSVLAFKMNAFPLLLQGGPKSIFWGAAHFFQSPIAVPQALARRIDTQHGVWMDEFHEGILRAVTFYYDRHFDQADVELRSLPATLAQEPNNQVQGSVLTARIARQLGQSERAARVYSELVHHPVFGREAQEALA